MSQQETIMCHRNTSWCLLVICHSLRLWACSCVFQAMKTFLESLHSAVYLMFA